MKILNKLNRSNQRGDTIIEVLMVLAILSLSFGISYATANRGIAQSENAQEHSQALGVLNGQLEELRSQIENNLASFPPASGYFCMLSVSPYFVTFANAVPATAQVDSAGAYGSGPYSEYPTQCVTSYYHFSITNNGSQYGYNTPDPAGCSPSACVENSYTLMIRWDGLGDLGPQQESLTYRIGSNPANVGVYQNPESVKGSVSLPGVQFQTCSVANSVDWEYCNVDGSSVFSYQATNTGGNPFQVTYSFLGTNIQNTDSSGYTLVLAYQNFTNPHYPPPSGYSFNVNIYVNGTKVASNVQLPITQSSYSLPLPGQTNAPSTVMVEWTNDLAPPPTDANFEINSITLNAN